MKIKEKEKSQLFFMKDFAKILCRKEKDLSNLILMKLC
jgi:hypothetical protein